MKDILQMLTFAIALHACLCATNVTAVEAKEQTKVKAGWTAQALKSFKIGCAAAIVEPAKRDYAAAAARAGNESPRPFPEQQLRESVEPMCRCIGARVATTWTVEEFSNSSS